MRLMVNRRGHGRGNGAPFGMAAGMRPVTEEARISIADQLAEFQRGQDTSECAAAAPGICTLLQTSPASLLHVLPIRACFVGLHKLALTRPSLLSPRSIHV